MSTPVEVTADYAYFRLRDEGYQQADIERWAATIAALPDVDGRVRLLQARGAGPGPGVRAAVHRRAAACEGVRRGSDPGLPRSDPVHYPRPTVRTPLPVPGQSPRRWGRTEQAQ